MALHSCGSCEVVDDDDSAKEEQWSPAWEDTFTGWDDMFGGGSKCDSTNDSDSEASAFCHAQGIGNGFGEVFPGWLRRRWEKERKGHELEALQQAGREASAAACLTGASSNQAPPDQIAKDKVAKTKIAKTKNAKTKIAKAKIAKTKIAKTKIACAKAGQALGGPARP